VAFALEFSDKAACRSRHQQHPKPSWIFDSIPIRNLSMNTELRRIGIFFPMVHLKVAVFGNDPAFI
jgi:hypothetical protein